MGEESEMTYANEAPGEHVQKEPPQELVQRQSHEALLILVGGVAPAEDDFPILQRHQTVIGDGYPVGIAPEIAERVLGPAEGRLA